MKPRAALLAIVFVLSGLAGAQPEPAAAQAPPAQAHFRVSLTGIRCNTATIDNVVSIDGAGDEVFALSKIVELTATNTIAATTVRESLTYGDTTGRSSPAGIAFALDHGPSRIHAGTASRTGGMRAGDVIPDPAVTPTPNRSRALRARVIPMILWEGQLRRGGEAPNAVVIVPTIWELDNIPVLRPVWDAQLDGYLRRVAAGSALIRNAPRPLVNQSDTVMQWSPSRNDFDRPIGMTGGAFNPAAATPELATFVPVVLFLTFDSAQEAASSIARNSRGRPGVIEIRYKDGPNYGPGDYTVTLQIERLSG